MFLHHNYCNLISLHAVVYITVAALVSQYLEFHLLPMVSKTPMIYDAIHLQNLNKIKKLILLFFVGMDFVGNGKVKVQLVLIQFPEETRTKGQEVG